MIIGDRIRQRLEDIGNTQAQLARAIGVSPQAISKMILGGTTDSPKLFQIARFLQTSPEYLMGESNLAELPAAEDVRLPFHGAAQPPDPDMVEIAEIDLNFGLGGAFMDEHPVPNMRSFSRSWLRQFTDASPEDLYWAKGKGDSMSPTIDDADPVLIDRRQQTPRVADLIWAFAWGEIGAIKRLRPMPDGGLKILSDNSRVPPEVAYDGEVHVFGRVVAIVKRV